jgi:hypothetical protein
MGSSKLACIELGLWQWWSQTVNSAISWSLHMFGNKGEISKKQKWRLFQNNVGYKKGIERVHTVIKGTSFGV